VIVLNDSPCETLKIGALSDFERGNIADERLAGASVTKTAKILGVVRAAVSEVTSALTNRGKTRPAKGNSGRRSTLTERDRLRRIGWKCHR
jgi:hypothetical protein